MRLARNLLPTELLSFRSARWSRLHLILVLQRVRMTLGQHLETVGSEAEHLDADR